MNVLKTLIDTAGDILGTSKLAKLNRTAFRPLIGTNISRSEYEMCNGSELFAMPDRHEQQSIQNLGIHDRNDKANEVLNAMVENGTVFSNKRLEEFCTSMQSPTQQTIVGDIPLRGSIYYQMSQDLRSSVRNDALLKRSL